AAVNDFGIVGVAPRSSLILIDGLSFSQSTMKMMFQYAIEKDADIISCSWGTVHNNQQPGPGQVSAINNALINGREGKGAVVVFAAGNEGLDYINYYGQIPGVIAVGATTSSGVLANYSNRGLHLSVVAPSNGAWPVIAARTWWDQGAKKLPYHQRFYRDGIERSPQHKHFGGTSSATAFVAGVCALILSVNPALTNTEVKLVLEQTADKIGEQWEYDEKGYSWRYGYGRVNAEKAVALAQELAQPAWGEVRNYGVLVPRLSEKVELCAPRDSLPKLPLREVKVKDPNSGKRYWLVYQQQEELMELRKLGFVIYKTRPLKFQENKDWWKRGVLDIFLKFGIDKLEEAIKP
ncbi:MAG: S8 family serine peptidase, partial [Bacteroidota bacterium]